MAQASMRAGQLDEALRAVSESVEINLDRGLSLGLAPVNLAFLAEVQIERGDLTGARRAIERGRKLALQQEAFAPLAMIDLQRTRLFIAEAETASTNRAREELDRIETFAVERGNLRLLAGVWSARSELAEFETNMEERTHALGEATRLYRACGDLSLADQLEAQLQRHG
jgi:ATP/maltotriose-dependent transcriptional regulator MalT